MPTGLPIMVPELPMFVASTAIRMYGVGFSFRRSHTWKISVEMKMMDVTSSTAQASSADATLVTVMNFIPERFGISTISCTIHVKKPRSRSAPTITIMPTRNRITSSEDDCTKCGMSSEPVKIRTARPRNASARRNFQKNSVPMMRPMNTAHATAWCDSSAWEKKPPRPTVRLTASRIRKRETKYLTEMEEDSSDMVSVTFL